MRKNIFLLFAASTLVIMNSCSECEQKAKEDQEIGYVHSSDNKQTNDTGQFFTVTLGGKSYAMEKIDPSFVSKGFEEESSVILKDKSMVNSSKPASCTSSYFAGTDRSDAKTSIYKDNVVTYNTIDDLIENLPATDEKMKNHDPKITKASNSERVTEEDRYVKIKSAYIYGIYRENDNDFHCIVGNGETSAKKMKLFNVEISGLPDKSSPDYNVMNDARNIIINQFGDIACKSGAFKPVKELIPISLEGSLFFDIDHPKGSVGFSKDGISYHPNTAWEIHPVAKLEFK